MKKMRRLIPAIAMLLVSAVMLSTASFAWFTMNEKVTASGMEIKAQAASSLLISIDPLSAANAGAPDATVEATGVTNLMPMTYDAGYEIVTGDDGSEAKIYNTVPGAQLSGNKTAGWYKPTDNSKNNIVTGLNGSSMGLVDSLEIADYHHKEEFYIATATDALIGADLTINMSVLKAPTDKNNQTYKAYAAAIYVVDKTMEVENEEGETEIQDNPAWLNGADITFTTQAPKAIVFVDSMAGRNTVTLKDVDVPSVSGAIEGTTVGLKIIVHFYVDGALLALANDTDYATKQVNAGVKYTSATGKYDDTKSYTKVTAELDSTVEAGEELKNHYTREGSAEAGWVYTPATGKAVDGVEYYTLTTATAIPDDTIKNEGITVADGWYTSAVYQVPSQYTYVRTADIPTEGTSLVLTFDAVVPKTGN